MIAVRPRFTEEEVWYTTRTYESTVRGLESEMKSWTVVKHPEYTEDELVVTYFPVCDE